MRVLVTGADGLLGSNLVRELLNRSYEVRIFVQPGRQQKTLEGLPLQRIEGDLLIEENIISAAIGCDYIIHLAANTSVWPSRSQIVRRVNIEGTKNIIAAAKNANVKRLICCSSASAFGFGTLENLGNENSPFCSDKYGLDYVDSKYKAQQLVLDEIKNGLPAIVVNPTFMLGPYDSIPSSGAMILAVYNKKVPGYSNGGRNYVYVKDVAMGIANAITKGRIGECYILGNKNYSYREMFNLISSVVGVSSPQIKFPDFVIKFYGLFNSFYATITSKKAIISYPLSLISCDYSYYSSQKAITELELPQTSIEQAVSESFDWLKENGYLNK